MKFGSGMLLRYNQSFNLCKLCSPRFDTTLNTRAIGFIKYRMKSTSSTLESLSLDYPMTLKVVIKILSRLALFLKHRKTFRSSLRSHSLDLEGSLNLCLFQSIWRGVITNSFHSKMIQVQAYKHKKQSTVPKTTRLCTAWRYSKTTWQS